MGIKRVVDVDFWNDEKVMEIFTPEDKLFFLYLLTNPHTTQLGIYSINPKHISFELGYSVESVNALLDRFENKYGIIKYSAETRELAVKNFLKHSIVKGGAPVRDCLIRELKGVKNKDLVNFVFAHIKQYEHINKTVQDIIADYEELNGDVTYAYEKRKSAEKEKNTNENVNDNENDVSYNESYHESCNESSPSPKSKPKKVRHKYGEYSNVLLSDEDMEKLKAEFPNDYQERIERLSEYMASSGKTYKNHLATIRNWARKDKNNDGQNSANVSKTDGSEWAGLLSGGLNL